MEPFRPGLVVRHCHKDVSLELGLVLPDSLDHRAVGYLEAGAYLDPVADALEGDIHGSGLKTFLTQDLKCRLEEHRAQFRPRHAWPAPPAPRANFRHCRQLYPSRDKADSRSAPVGSPCGPPCRSLLCSTRPVLPRYTTVSATQALSRAGGQPWSVHRPNRQAVEGGRLPRAHGGVQRALIRLPTPSLPSSYPTLLLMKSSLFEGFSDVKTADRPMTGHSMSRASSY